MRSRYGNVGNSLGWRQSAGDRAAFIVFLWAASAGVTLLCAQEKERELWQQDQQAIRDAPGSKFRTYMGGPVANVELPAHVVAEENKLTFFADFAHAGEKGVPLYLVNRTGKAVELDTQDHDPYLKLEYRDEQGRWIRAQPHMGSGCGNSYYSVSLESGQHFRFHGYRAKDGNPATVRYRSTANPELVSHVGAGRVNALDLAAAPVDDMAAAEIPYSLREALYSQRFGDPAGKRPPSAYVAALSLLSHYSDNLYYRREAKRYLEKLDPKIPEAAVIQSLLAKQWPVEPDCLGLLQHIDAVTSDKKQAISVDEKEMALRVVGDLMSDRKSGGVRHASSAEWKDVLHRIYGRIGESMMDGNGREAEAATKALAVPEATDEYVPTDKLRSWLGHGNEKVVEVSAMALSRRGDLLYLADKGFSLKPNERILILKALATDRDARSRISRNPDGEREVEFWKLCATEQPVQTVQALQYIGEGGAGQHSFNMVLHDPLRAFLEKEAELAEKNPQVASSEEHGYSVAQVLEFVGAWHREEDIPLFRRFLKHPGFQSGISYESSGKRFEVRRFRVREDAKQVLHALRVSVPDDIVLEEKIPLPDEPGRK